MEEFVSQNQDMSQKDLFEEETINGIPIVDVESQDLFDLADEDLSGLLAQFEALPTQSRNGANINIDGSGRSSSVVPPREATTPIDESTILVPDSQQSGQDNPPSPIFDTRSRPDTVEVCVQTEQPYEAPQYPGPSGSNTGPPPPGGDDINPSNAPGVFVGMDAAPEPSDPGIPLHGNAPPSAVDGTIRYGCILTGWTRFPTVGDVIYTLHDGYMHVYFESSRSNGNRKLNRILGKQ